jgi:hypothetical protein
MITNLETEPRFWSVKFADKPYAIYSWGDDAINAISAARQEVDTATNSGALVRPAVYKEWNHGTEHYTNGGDFIRDTSKPCSECGTPVEFHTHKTELGFCVDCSWRYWNHELEAN